MFTRGYLPPPILIHKHVIWIFFRRGTCTSSNGQRSGPGGYQLWADFSHKIRFGFDPHVCWLNNGIYPLVMTNIAIEHGDL